MVDPAEVMAALRADVLAALRSPQGEGAAAVVCRGCVRVLPVDGAAISVIGQDGERETLFATDATMARIESVQFTLGEGPCVEAVRARRPVLAADLAEDGLAWPVFAAEIAPHPAGAIFAFPVQQGAIGFGALDLYRRLPGWLSDADLALALAIVDLAAIALLGGLPPEGDAWPTSLSHWREDVHQATGMLIAELGVSAEQALARLRARAFSTGALIEDVARSITTRDIHPAELET